MRDHERNEDESGNSTIVEAKTNYFVFPGETGVDATWLMGAEFAAKVELSFTNATTGSLFVLIFIGTKANKNLNDPLNKVSRLGNTDQNSSVHFELYFEAKVGELVAPPGPSGCGKSNLLNLISGLRRSGRRSFCLRS